MTKCEACGIPGKLGHADDCPTQFTIKRPVKQIQMPPLNKDEWPTL